jgi:hypothetical protein
MKLNKALCAVALAMAISGAAAASEVTFEGSASGCFSGGCIAGTTDNFGSLAYFGSTFDTTTLGGFAALGGDPSAPLTMNFNNLGSFTLSGRNDPFKYDGVTFKLLVSFSVPAGIGDQTVAGVLTGTAAETGNGGVFIDFDNTPLNFTFSGGTGTFMVSDLNVNAGQTASVTGHLTEITTSVPEPSTWAMMILGFFGIGFMAYRRRNQTVPLSAA